MKRKVFIMLAISFLVSTSAIFAQQRSQKDNCRKKGNIERLQSTMIGYITCQLDLTPSEAEKFWPLFNEMQTKKKELKKPITEEMSKLRDIKKSGTQLKDEDYTKLVSLNLDYKIKDAELNKSYFDKFVKILPPEKVFKLERSTQQFSKKITARLEYRTHDRISNRKTKSNNKFEKTNPEQGREFNDNRG